MSRAISYSATRLKSKPLLTVTTANQMQLEQFSNQSAASANSNFDVDSPQCCGTGCAVCVLDYPELFSLNQTDSGQTDCNMLALLEAVEQAQLRAGEMVANGDSR